MRFSRIVAGLALALVAASAGAQDAPGVGKDKIKIGILGSLTGPAAVWGTGNLAGGVLAFEEANAAGASPSSASRTSTASEGPTASPSA